MSLRCVCALRTWLIRYSQTSDAYHDEAILGVEWEKEINGRVEKLAKKKELSMANVALGKYHTHSPFPICFST